MKWLIENFYFVMISSIVVAIGVFFFGPSVLAMLKKKPVESTDQSKTTGTPDPTFPLKLGSTGEKVKSLQRYLNFTGSYGLTVDGSFGTNTEKAVVSELTGVPGITNPKQVPQWYYDQFIGYKFSPV